MLLYIGRIKDKRQKMIRKNKAFTLMEIMMVIILMGTLMVYAISDYNKAIKKGYERRMTSALTAIYAANENYKQQSREDTGTYWAYGSGSNPIAVTIAEINTNLGLNIIDDPSITFAYISDGTTGYLMEAYYKQGESDGFSLQLWGGKKDDDESPYGLRNVPKNETNNFLNPCCNGSNCPTLLTCDIP